VTVASSEGPLSTAGKGGMVWKRLPAVEAAELSLGFRESVAIALSFAVYGAVWGNLARQAGLSTAESVAMSIFVCAGTAQFAVLPGLLAGASLWSLAITTYIVNLPNYLMAASLAPHLTGLSRLRLALLAHGISNSTYALTQARFARHRPYAAYFVGSTLAVYGAWCGGTLVGALLGERIPDPRTLGLDMVFPAVFIAIAIRTIRSARDWVVAVGAAVVAVAVAWRFGGTWHIAVAGVGASLIGLWPERSTTTAKGTER
jgi:4-azaleucine resistance transporter AzlC